MRQAFDDGGLTHAWFADQHWVVLGTAAQDLDDALEFLITAYQRIELRIHGSLGQVTRELAQQGRLAVALGLRLFLCRACQFLADARQPQSTLMQNFGGEAFLFAQKSQQQMFSADVLM